MIVKNPIGLIGDVLGTFPILQELNRRHENFSVVVDDEIKWVYDLVPEIHLCDCKQAEKELNLSQAFHISQFHGCYMTAAHYPILGMPMPAEPSRAELTVKEVDVPIYDFVFAPFGRSAPSNQKWSMDQWYELSKLLEGHKIAIVGSSKHDQYEMFYGDFTHEYDCDAHRLANILLKAKHGCISIVTGISHLCYHLGVKNYLLTNQGDSGWGINPDSVKITNLIPTLTAREVYDRITTQ